MTTPETFIVTGASRGLGRDVAAHLLSLGYSVAALGRSTSDLVSLSESFAGRLNESQKLTVHPVDLTNDEDVAMTMKKIGDAHANIRALFNIAGTWSGRRRVYELSREDLQKSLDLNFFSAFNITRELLASRKQAGSRTPLSIIFTGATASLRGGATVAAFCVAKAALRTLAQSLAKEVGKEGVHVSHLVIDGLLDNERTRLGNPSAAPDIFISQKAVAESMLSVALQDPSCWTFEWELRPFNESW